MCPQRVPPSGFRREFRSEPIREAAGSRCGMVYKARVGGCAVAAAGVLLGACSAVDSTSTDRFSANGELIALSGGGAGAANACFTCHGLAGQGDGAGTPRLAGLELGYLLRQLEAYSDGRRRHPQMSWIANNLSPAERVLVSGHYAAMDYDGAAPRRMPVPLLYVAGDPQRGIPACASCHGLRGQGLGSANPPLAGQPAPYQAEQFDQWRRGRRRNDAAEVMLRISQLLTPSESAALATYAQGLPGGPPSPESPEAFPAARRADPRNDVSGRRLHVPESARAAE